MLYTVLQTKQVTRSVSSDFQEGLIQHVLWLACKVSTRAGQRHLLIVLRQAPQSRPPSAMQPSAGSVCVQDVFPR